MSLTEPTLSAADQIEFDRLMALEPKAMLEQVTARLDRHVAESAERWRTFPDRVAARNAASQATQAAKPIFGGIPSGAKPINTAKVGAVCLGAVAVGTALAVWHRHKQRTWVERVAQQPQGPQGQVR